MGAPPTRALRRLDRSASAKVRCSASIRYCVGTPIIVVTRRSPTRRSTRAGSKDRSSTTVAPVHHASRGWMFQAPTWNWGSTLRTTSCSLSSTVRDSDRLVHQHARCESTAALGALPVPEVKTTSRGSSSSTASTGAACSRRSGRAPGASSVLRYAVGTGVRRRSATCPASRAVSSSTTRSTGVRSSTWRASSAGASRHDSGARAAPRRAQAKRRTTCSALLPTSVAMRSPRPVPAARSRRVRFSTRSSSSA